MKKLFGFLGIIAAAVVLPITANAEAKFDFDCKMDTLEPGGTTTCSVTVDDYTQEGISEATLTATELQDITISGFTANSGKWSANTLTEGKAFKVTPIGDSTGISGPVGEFTIKLAANPVSEENCGRICLKVEYYKNNDGKTSDKVLTALTGVYNSGDANDPNCEDITISTTGTPSPSTGAFADYAVIIGAGVVAIAVIMLATKKSKFYHV